MEPLKFFLKNIFGEKVLIAYHEFVAYIAAFLYGFPSRKLVVVGITGTKGKTSSANFTHSVLSQKYKTGLIGTANIKIGTDEESNSFHMTMLPPFKTQRLLYSMVKLKCTHVVIEVSSEGLKQKRHKGIDFDIACFTNISPEHLPSHNNSFEEYKKAKTILFQSLRTSYKKNFFKEKWSVVNSDNNEDYVLYNSFWADKKISYGIHNGEIKPLSYSEKMEGSSVTFLDGVIDLKLPGLFNISNTLLAYSVGTICGLTFENIKNGIEAVSCIPGRMEKINEGQNFNVFIDYAHEKLSMTSLLETIQKNKKTEAKIIVLFGAQGGGRDKRKRKDMAEVASKVADIIILTEDDSYEEPTKMILEDIAQYVIGKEVNKDFFVIENRSDAIYHSFSLAKQDDIVLITGKGAEKTMITNGGTIPWDERKIVKDLLNKYIKSIN